MRKSLLFLLLLSLITASCSGNKAEEDVAADTAGIEMEDASDAEFEEEAMAPEEEMAEVSEGEAEPEELAATEEIDDVEEMDSEEPEVADSGEKVEINESAAAAGGMGTYTVEKNETLMWIAFKIYGDYSKWKEIRDMNPGVVKGTTVIAGSQLKYTQPSEAFVYNPKGNPYLIKKEDTLGTISDDVYGTVKHWKYIWDNNKRQIKNPNLIFAGFTIYYLPLRDVANN